MAHLLSEPATGMRFTSTVPYSDFCLKYPNTGVFAHGSYNLYICLYMHVFSYRIFKNCTQSFSHASHSIPAPTTSYKLVTSRYILYQLLIIYWGMLPLPPHLSWTPRWTPEKDILKLNWILEWYLQPPYSHRTTQLFIEPIILALRASG